MTNFGPINIGPHVFDDEELGDLQQRQAAQRARQALEQQGAAPQGGTFGQKFTQGFQQNPLQSMGLLLGNTVAGFQGRPLPSVQFDQQQLQQRQFEEQRMVTSVKILNDGLEAISDLDPDLRQRMAGQYANFTKGRLPEVSAVFEDIADGGNFDQTRKESLFSLHPIIQKLWAVDPEAAIDLIGDEEAVGNLWRTSALADGDDVRAKVSGILNGQSVDWRTFRQANAQAGEQGLTSYEKGLIQVDPSIVADLITGIPETEGVEFDNPSDQAALRVRARGGTVESGRFEISDARMGDINALTPDEAEAELTAGKFGRTESDLAAKARVDFDSKEVAVRNIVREAGRLHDLSEQDPGLTTTTRGLVNVAGSAAANVDALVRDFNLNLEDVTFKVGLSGKELEANGSLRDQVENLFPGLAGSSAAYQAAAYNLVYMVAAARGVSGRALSDFELKRTMENVGITRDDPVALRAAMKETQRQAIEGLRTEAKVKGVNKNLSDLDAFLEKTPTEFDAMSDEELIRKFQDSGFRRGLTGQRKADFIRIANERGLTGG